MSADRRCDPWRWSAAAPGACAGAAVPAALGRQARVARALAPAGGGRARRADARRPCRSSPPAARPSSPCAHRQPAPASRRRPARRGPRARRSSSPGTPSPDRPVRGRAERARLGQPRTAPRRRSRRPGRVRTTAPSDTPNRVRHTSPRASFPIGFVTGECLRPGGPSS